MARGPRPHVREDVGEQTHAGAVGVNDNIIRRSRREALTPPFSRLRAFLASMRGGSHPHLQRYADRLCFRKPPNRAEGNRMDPLCGHEAEGQHAMARELTHLKDHPKY